MENNNLEIKNNNASWGLIIGIILCGVFVIGFGIFIFLNKGEDVSEKTTNKKYNDLIKIDASLATQPLTDAYIKNLENFNLQADYSNTDPAYTKLINKEVDLIVVTEPSEEELKRAKNANVEFDITPVVNEGFVFYTNVENPVSSLTLEEVQKIYTGDITNWKQVGGKDAEIIAYQRPVNSGSQTGILSLVMKDKKMKEPKTSEYILSMAGIIEVVSNYENGKNAIGYSYYYYATTMYGNAKMKFFRINDVEPNHDTIKNESYPLITAYYIVTLKDNAKEAVKELKKALLSKEGQNIAQNAGYIELG